MENTNNKTYGTGYFRINLNSPRGNAYELLGIAGNLMDRLPHYTEEIQDAITKEMMDGDYEHLLETFAKHFGRVFFLYYSRKYEMELQPGEWGDEVRDDDEEECEHCGTPLTTEDEKEAKYCEECDEELYGLK